MTYLFKLRPVIEFFHCSESAHLPSLSSACLRLLSRQRLYLRSNIYTTVGRCCERTIVVPRKTETNEREIRSRVAEKVRDVLVTEHGCRCKWGIYLCDSYRVFRNEGNTNYQGRRCCVVGEYEMKRVASSQRKWWRGDDMTSVRVTCRL